MNARLCLAFCLTAASAGTLGAQTFGPLVGGHLPPQVATSGLPFSGAGGTPPEIEDLLVGDLDGDGAPDLVVLGHGVNVVCRSDRAGGLVFGQSLPAPPDTVLRRGAFADVDGDGDLDLFAGEGAVFPARPRYGPMRLYENQGGTFQDVTGRMPSGSWNTSALVAVDHDGDDVEPASAPYAGVRRILLFDNDGAGRFTETTATRLPALPIGQFLRLVATDQDRDGDRDLVATAEGSRCSSATTGTGRCADLTASLPRGNEALVTVVDIDRDGDDDLMLTTRILLNDGTAMNFVSRDTGLTIEPQAGVHVADLDGDGRLDPRARHCNADTTRPPRPVRPARHRSDDRARAAGDRRWHVTRAERAAHDRARGRLAGRRAAARTGIDGAAERASNARLTGVVSDVVTR